MGYGTNTNRTGRKLMAKKVNQTFTATMTKNTEKGGAWLVDFLVVTEGVAEARFVQTAWANAGAGKRWLKAMVLANTPRKSVKMLVGAVDATDKPISFKGELTYKVDA
jgi:hypothetical protein